MTRPFAVESPADPHRDQPIETAGAPREAAEATVVLLHGRGSTATRILRLIDEFLHRGVMYLAPQAARRTWYPRSGDAPFEANEPWLSSALARVSAAIEVAADADIPPERVLLFGFSQGGSVASEFVARNPRRYGGLAVFSGGLPGPTPVSDRDVEGSLDGTPVFLGCSDEDPYISAERIRATEAAFERLGGDVVARLYDGLGHEINDDEVRTLDALVGNLV